MTSEVFIRADGNHEIGLGHLIRCMALANMLKIDFDITFISREIPGKIKEELSENSIRLEEITSENEFLKMLHSGRDIVVLDGYQFDKEYQEKIKKKDCALVCIDDIHDREFAADLIINHAPGVTQSDYSAKKDTDFALGPDYALLRPSFLNYASQSTSKSDTGTVLICFGGSDSKNLTITAVKEALNFDPFKKIIIITGSAYEQQSDLLSLIKGKEQIEYYHAVDEKQMFRLMKESDTAIVPASGILFEVLATGNTAISGMYTENQKKVYSGFKELNAIVDAGTFRPDEITRALDKSGSYKKKKIIDGKSPKRIINLFKNL